MAEAQSGAENLRALVVDDQSFVRSAIAHSLSRLGVGEVLQASDGDEALAFLEDSAKPVNLVFCDLHMPGRDGIEVLRDLVRLHPDAGVV